MFEQRKRPLSMNYEDLREVVLTNDRRAPSTRRIRPSPSKSATPETAALTAQKRNLQIRCCGLGMQFFRFSTHMSICTHKVIYSHHFLQKACNVTCISYLGAHSFHIIKCRLSTNAHAPEHTTPHMWQARKSKQTRISSLNIK